MARLLFNEDFGENQRALELFLHICLRCEDEPLSRHTTSKSIEAIYKQYGLRRSFPPKGESFSPHQFDNSIRLLRQEGRVDENGVPTKNWAKQILDMWQRSYGRQRFDPSWKGPTNDDLRIAVIIWHHSGSAALRGGQQPLTFSGLPSLFRRGHKSLARGRHPGLSYTETKQLQFMFETLLHDWEHFTKEEREQVQDGFSLFEEEPFDSDQPEKPDESLRWRRLFRMPLFFL